MKVLFIANSCCSNITSKKRYYTGYDYIVSDIAERLSCCCQIDIFSLNPCPENSRIGDVRIKSCVKYKRLLRYFKVKDIVRYFIIFYRSLPDVRKALKNILWYLSVYEINEIIRKNDYDIIHIHGVSFGCFNASVAAANNNKPFLFTLHGLLSYGVPGILRIDKLSEVAAFDVINNNNLYVTTVSAGTKRIPCKDKGIDPSKIIIINNAIKLTPCDNYNYWYDKFPQAKGKTIVIGVGTIGENKNQIQLLRAYMLLPNALKDQIVIMLAGKDISNGLIAEYISEHKLQNNVFLCGFINKKELSSLYAIANFNVMLSYSEGFGLSMIEAASYGIPSLTFSDLDAVKDIYSPKSMLLMDNRSDNTVADGIIKMLVTKWDKEAIIKESKKFNEDIYLEYMNVYKMILKEGTNLIDPKVITDALGL